MTSKTQIQIIESVQNLIWSSENDVNGLRSIKAELSNIIDVNRLRLIRFWKDVTDQESVFRAIVLATILELNEPYVWYNSVIGMNLHREFIDECVADTLEIPYMSNPPKWLSKRIQIVTDYLEAE